MAKVKILAVFYRRDNDMVRILETRYYAEHRSDIAIGGNGEWLLLDDWL